MRISVRSVLETLFIVLFLGLCIVAGGISRRAAGETVLARVEIEVLDSAEYAFVTKRGVRELIRPFRLQPQQVAVDSLPLLRIREAIRKDPYVRRADVYRDLQGTLHIEIRQFAPRVRFITRGYRTLFADAEGNVLPQRGVFAVDIPVVTLENEGIGEAQIYAKKGGEKSLFTENILNFVDYIVRDNFWNSMIVQINVNRQGDVELIPRAGDEVIVLCPVSSLREYPAYLEKLKQFYAEMNREELWGRYGKINLKYENQVVCTKK